MKLTILGVMKSNLSRINFLLSIHIVLVTFVTGCSLVQNTNNKLGELIGVQGRGEWGNMYVPLDMVLVPGGNFVMGMVSEDISGKVAVNRQVSISSFYMDSTPITNNKYRQFVDAMLDIAAANEEENEVESESESDEQFDNDSTVVEKDLVEGAGQKLDDDSSDNDSKDTDGNSAKITKDYVMKFLYPNSNVWKEDFMHRMADPMVENYYESPYFDNFPVVGISWEAAREFCKWRTKLLNDRRKAKGLPLLPSFRLCTAAEFEYAARGGQPLSKYPWGGPYVRDSKGKILANFKVGKGNYAESGYTYTSPVKHFAPNGYGLYDMCGNVSHWCLDSYSFSFDESLDLDPMNDDQDEPRKIIKGGSWKDISYYLQSGVSDWAHKDSSTAYIGFRCVMPYFGASTK